MHTPYIIHRYCIQQGQQEGHICGSCYIALERQYKVVVASNVDTDSCEEVVNLPGSPVNKMRRKLARYPRDKKSGAIEIIVSALRNSKYRWALSKLISISLSAKVAFQETVRVRVTKEMRSYTRNNANEFAKPIDTKSIENFSWTAILSELKVKLPTFSAAVRGSIAVTRNKYEYV